MSAYEVLKHSINETEPREVHQNASYFGCEEFVHIALAQPENADCLYTINEGERIMAGYKMVDGQIVCKSMAKAA